MKSLVTSGNEAQADAPAPVVELPTRRPGLLEQLESEAVVIRTVSLDAIEPDPDQPREYFDPTELQELADSLRSEGLLQEPAVYPIAMADDGRPSRYRLLFGERRWRAARLAGWSELRCKILPSNRDEDLITRLKRIDQQSAENSARAALSAVEEARALHVKLGVLRQLNPSSTASALVEQVAQERRLSASTVWRLLDLLNAPAALRAAILQRKVTSRDLAFQLASYWSRLLKEHQADTKAKRELNFHNAVKDWAEKQGLELNADALNRYAAEHFLEPKMVKASIKTAEKIERSAEEEFSRVVTRAIENAWTVKDARKLLSGSGERSKETDTCPPLFERSDVKGKARLTIHTARLQDAAIATSDARRELAVVLRELLMEVERGCSQEATPARTEVPP